MGQLAMRPVDLAPLVEQRQDRRGLLGEQPVHARPAGRSIRQPAAGPAAQPAVRPPLGELEPVAGPAQRPAGVEGLLEQVEQAGLGGRVHPGRDPAT